MTESGWSETAQGLLQKAGRWLSRPRPAGNRPVRIGVALGGGFARGIAHVGVLRALERNGVEVACIAGVSAGSIVAAAYASGASVDEIEQVARGMRFKDVARWTVSRFGLAETDRMVVLLKRLLKTDRFEAMRLPVAVVASDLMSGKPAVFRDLGDVSIAIRASCAYPGLFLPVRHDGRYLVDGLISMEVPAAPLRSMGATHVISVALPPAKTTDPRSVACVVSRCFDILSARTQHEWRRQSSLVLEPEVADVPWDSFGSCGKLIEAGVRAAEAAMPTISKWIRKPEPAAILGTAPAMAAKTVA
jgi:NTE family protein